MSLPFFFFLITISLLYFFYLPNLTLFKSKKLNKSLHKWTWMW